MAHIKRNNEYFFITYVVVKILTGLFSYPKRNLRKLIRNGDFKEAIELGNNLEEKYSQDHDFLFIMGSMFYILEDPKMTLHYVNRVLEINEHDVDALSLKLRVHQHLKENDIVIECCKKILSVNSDNYEVKDILNELEG